MYRYQGLSARGPSKATASTLCQKCLKRDNFECKAIVQERPYVARPSRTQQLFNPNLVPQLSSDVPQDLLRKKGIADEQLARTKRERIQKQDRKDENGGGSRRSRSASSASSISVDTISTTRSGLESSSSHATRRRSYSSPRAKLEQKRKRSSQSEGSFMSSDEGGRQRERRRASSRSTRRKIRDTSPLERGRRRGRTYSRERRSISSGSDEYRERIRRRSKHFSPVGAHGSHSHQIKNTKIGGAGRSSSISDEPRQQYHGDRRRRIGNRGVTYSTHQLENEPRLLDTSSARQAQDAHGTNDDHQRGNGVKDERRAMNMPQRKLSNRGTQKERSLSPFSKRLALTQAMNMGL